MGKFINFSMSTDISIVIEMIVVRIAELEKDIFLELELHKILEQELELWLLDR